MHQYTQEFGQDVDSAMQSVKAKLGHVDSFKHHTNDSSIVVGGHLIENQLHQSITDPEIQTGEEQAHQEEPARKDKFGRNRHKSREKKRGQV